MMLVIVLLLTSIDSLNYFAMMGLSLQYIGYTHLYPEYVNYTKKAIRHCLHRGKIKKY